MNAVWVGQVPLAISPGAIVSWRQSKKLISVFASSSSHGDTTTFVKEQLSVDLTAWKRNSSQEEIDLESEKKDIDQNELQDYTPAIPSLEK